jgi:hypothetical protein
MYQLKLAEGPQNKSINLNEVEFLLVPDPENKRRPYYFREDVFYSIPGKAFNALIQYIKPFNDINKLNRFIARYQSKRNGALNDDGYSYGDDPQYGGSGASGANSGSSGSGIDWGQIGTAAAQLGLEIVNQYVQGEINAAQGTQGTGTTPGTYVSPGGWVLTARNFGGQNIMFAVQPANRSIIAFSTPELVRKMFSNLPSCPGGVCDYIPLPEITPAGLISLALQNPNKIVRIKPGTGAVGTTTNQFEVVGYPAILGLDAGGNPITTTPPPVTPGENPTNEDNENNQAGGGGIGSILPLAGIGLLVSLMGSR